MRAAAATDVPAPAAIELRGVVQDFASGLRGLKVRALDRVDLRVPCGKVFGLLGPNGSGKSTAIKVMLGLLTPTMGVVTISGGPSTRREARRAIGYMPEAPQFYPYLTGRELVRFYARLCGMAGAVMESRIGIVLKQVGIAEAADRRVGGYSKGMLQRIGLAQAMVHDPEILILDEPTAGLDPLGTAAISKLVLELKAAGKTVLLTSHLLSQMEELCDRIAILDRGRVILEGKMPEVLGTEAQQVLAVDALSAADSAELRAWLATRGATLGQIETRGARLDKLFLARVSGERS